MAIGEIIGLTAACLTMFSFVPQIVKTARTRSSKDVSVVMLLQLSLGVSLWVVYGVYRRDPVIILANIVTLISLITLVFLYFFFAYKKKVRL